MMEMKMIWKKWLSQSNLTEFAVIMLTAYILSALFAFHTFNPDKILDQGKVYDFSSEDCTRDGEGIRYDFSRHAYEITEERGALTFAHVDPSVEWRYLYVKAKLPSQETIPVRILYYNKDNSIFASQQEELYPGENYITMASGKGCKTMVFTIDGQKGRMFSLDEVQIRYRLPKSGKQIFLLTIVIGVILSAVWKLAVKRVFPFVENWKIPDIKKTFPIDLLTFIHWRLGMDAYNKLKETSFYRRREEKRTGLFIVLFLGIIIGNQKQYFTNKLMYKYCILFSCVIFLLLTLLSLEGKDQKKVYTGRLANIWIVFWAMTCVSDFFAFKFYKFTGWVMLLVMGIFFYWWRQMEKPEKIWREAVNALRYLFYPMAVFCVLYRPKTGGVMYNGFCRNSHEFAVYALLMWALFILHLIWNMQKKASVFFDGAGAVICFYYLLAAGDYYCIILALAYIAGMILFNRKKIIRRKIAMYFLAAMAAILLGTGMHALTRFLPVLLKEQVVYEDERKETNKDGEILRQLKMADQETYGDVKKQNFKDIVLVWKAYGRKLNIQGNTEKSLSVWGGRENCRNGILEMMFRYGIFIFIPYVLLMFYGAKSVVISLRKENVSFERQWEFVVVLGFILLNMLESVEIPFGSVPWVMFYLFLGYTALE